MHEAKAPSFSVLIKRAISRLEVLKGVGFYHPPQFAKEGTMHHNKLFV